MDANENTTPVVAHTPDVVGRGIAKREDSRSALAEIGVGLNLCREQLWVSACHGFMIDALTLTALGTKVRAKYQQADEEMEDARGFRGHRLA